MNTPTKIALFTLAVTGFYTYVGAIVPQMESHPPEAVAIGADMSPAELSEAGREIFFGKGTCALCHTIGEKGQRCPDLAGIGVRAADRVAELSAEEYLAQSLYDPNAYLVDGYTPTMPPIDRAPIGLNAHEIVAVVAFLQSLGGVVTVTPSTRFSAAGAASGEAASASASPAAAGGTLDAPAILEKYGCAACHSFDGPERRIGPSLYDLGARRTRAEILESLVDPDAVLTEGEPPYPPGLMAATLAANAFFEDLSLVELQALAEHLGTLRGESP